MSAVEHKKRRQHGRGLLLARHHILVHRFRQTRGVVAGGKLFIDQYAAQVAQIMFDAGNFRLTERPGPLPRPRIRRDPRGSTGSSSWTRAPRSTPPWR